MRSKYVVSKSDARADVSYRRGAPRPATVWSLGCNPTCPRLQPHVHVPRRGSSSLRYCSKTLHAALTLRLCCGAARSHTPSPLGRGSNTQDHAATHRLGGPPRPACSRLLPPLGPERRAPFTCMPPSPRGCRREAALWLAPQCLPRVACQLHRVWPSSHRALAAAKPARPRGGAWRARLRQGCARRCERGVALLLSHQGHASRGQYPWLHTVASHRGFTPWPHTVASHLGFTPWLHTLHLHTACTLGPA